MLLANGDASRADGITTTTTVEVDFPPETVVDGVLFVGFALAGILLIFFLWRDTSRLSHLSRAWLLLLRLSAFVGVLIIALNPHQRTQKESFRLSQVILLADTSTSMQQPASDPAAGTSVEAAEVRWEVIQQLLAERPDVTGLAVPGMPVGSPGMEVDGYGVEPFTVIAFDAAGSTEPFASYPE